MPEIPYRYWDACVMLSWVNGNDPDRMSNIEPMMAKSLKGDDFRIVTSVLSMVEVAFGKQEQDRRALDEATELKINRLWAPGSAIAIVEFYPLIALHARTLMRRALNKEWALKPADALHLATADHLKANSFDTYDERLFRMKEITDTNFPIGPPVADAPTLALGHDTTASASGTAPSTTP